MSKSHEPFNFFWSISDGQRGPYRPPQCDRVMLPLVVLYRFVRVLRPTKPSVLEKFSVVGSMHRGEASKYNLNQILGQQFHNQDPPIGIDGKCQRKVMVREQEKQGFFGRFGAGSDEIDVRNWVIENDWHEAIVAMLVEVDADLKRTVANILRLPSKVTSEASSQ